MANSLTLPQKVTFSEIIGIPYGAKLIVHDGAGIAPYTPMAGGYPPDEWTTLSSVVDTYIASYPDEIFDRLIIYITRWDVLGTSTVTLTQGAVDDVQGVTMDPEAERAIIRERVRHIAAGIMARYDLSKARAGSASGNSGDGFRTINRVV